MSGLLWLCGLLWLTGGCVRIDQPPPAAVEPAVSVDLTSTERIWVISSVIFSVICLAVAVDAAPIMVQ